MARHKTVPDISSAAWLHEPSLLAVFKALEAGGGEVRVAGGAVRNTLLGAPVADVDLATPLLPDDVMRLARKAGLSIHPTGLEHGTVTVVADGRAFEVTTLRRDVETDGRHAVVSFSQAWADDARRRDFTMNALYCDSAGKVYDFTDGYADVLKRRVRFVGVPSKRIREDYLRILRFFRFHAAYGKGAPDADGLAACESHKAGLGRLSAERIRQELLKLLAAPRAVPTLKVMAKSCILKKIIPYHENWRLLQRLPADAILRLAMLSAKPAMLKDALRLSNAEGDRIRAIGEAPRLSPALTLAEQRRMLYQLGVQTWRDAAHVSFAQSGTGASNANWQALIDLPEHWLIPAFPVNGADLRQQGMAPGPAIGQFLRELEDWWVASDFKPGKDQLMRRINLKGNA